MRGAPPPVVTCPALCHPIHATQVDAVLTGHIHAYQRSCIGVIKGRCVGVDASNVALGPTYVMTGAAAGSADLALACSGCKEACC